MVCEIAKEEVSVRDPADEDQSTGEGPCLLRSRDKRRRAMQESDAAKPQQTMPPSASEQQPVPAAIG